MLKLTQNLGGMDAPVSLLKQHVLPTQAIV